MMYNDLIKRLRHYPEDFVAYKMDADFANTVREAANAIEKLICEVADEHNARLDAEERQHWIPVTERLPEKSGSYLVFVYGEVTEMNFWYGKWHRLRDDYTKAVTHWMPLPQPPKEE